MPAVFPAEGEVKLGVQYGPITGVEFTGTRTSPVVTNVETGIRYGAAGTEFEGTLSVVSGVAQQGWGWGDE